MKAVNGAIYAGQWISMLHSYLVKATAVSAEAPRVVLCLL